MQLELLYSFDSSYYSMQFCVHHSLFHIRINIMSSDEEFLRITNFRSFVLCLVHILRKVEPHDMTWCVHSMYDVHSVRMTWSISTVQFTIPVNSYVAALVKFSLVQHILFQMPYYVWIVPTPHTDAVEVWDGKSFQFFSRARTLNGTICTFLRFRISESCLRFMTAAAARKEEHTATSVWPCCIFNTPSTLLDHIHSIRKS